MRRFRRFLSSAVLATTVLAVVGLAGPAAASTRPAAGQAVVADSASVAVYPNCYAVIGNPYPWDSSRTGVYSGANCNGASGVYIITYLYHYDWGAGRWVHGGNNNGRWVYLGYVNGYKSSFAWDWSYYCYWKAETRVKWPVGGVTYMQVDWSAVVNICS
ncbi:MAG TPA: hypothetical protein VFM55_25660 [Micromonosporaceae bacterium]|nr:hypothetical protein [Micromonosporaceae bacterium]